MESAPVTTLTLRNSTAARCSPQVPVQLAQAAQLERPWTNPALMASTTRNASSARHAQQASFFQKPAQPLSTLSAASARAHRRRRCIRRAAPLRTPSAERVSAHLICISGIGVAPHLTRFAPAVTVRSGSIRSRRASTTRMRDVVIAPLVRRVLIRASLAQESTAQYARPAPHVQLDITPKWPAVRL